MKENMTNWQKISAILNRVESEPSCWHRDAVEMAVLPLLIELINKNDSVVVSVPENYNDENHELSLIKNKNEKYVLVFPNEESAESLGENTVFLPTVTIFGDVSSNTDIAGILYVCDIDTADKKFTASAIARELIVTALDISTKERHKKNNS